MGVLPTLLHIHPHNESHTQTRKKALQSKLHSTSIFQCFMAFTLCLIAGVDGYPSDYDSCISVSDPLATVEWPCVDHCWVRCHSHRSPHLFYLCHGETMETEASSSRQVEQ